MIVNTLETESRILDQHIKSISKRTLFLVGFSIIFLQSNYINYLLKLIKNCGTDDVALKKNVVMIQSSEMNFIASNNNETPSKMTLGKNQNTSHELNTLLDNNSSTPKVMIEMRYPRSDRLGSSIRRPFYLLAFARCNGYEFCIVKGREGSATYFNFQICPEDLYQDYPRAGVLFQDVVNKSGTYSFKHDDGPLGRWVKNNKKKCFDDAFRREWKEMLINASSTKKLGNETLLRQDFFQEANQNSNISTVAVHIRRGDYADWGRHLIHDEIYVGVIYKIRSMLSRLGKTPSVHLFSEDYGMIDWKLNITRNWNLYEGLVDHFHLAPEMRKEKRPHIMDIALNLRDWKHFVKADILVVGNSIFSQLPAYGRPRFADPRTGFPLTIYPCYWNRHCFRDDDLEAKYLYRWSKGNKKQDMQILINLPDVFESSQRVTEN